MRQYFDIAISDRAAKGGHTDAAQDVEGDLRAYAADCVDQQTKQVALRGAHETVERVGVFAHRQVGEQLNFLARLRQFVVRRKRDQHLVANAVDGDDDLRREGLDEFSVEKGDHDVITSWAR